MYYNVLNKKNNSMGKFRNSLDYLTESRFMIFE